MRKGGIGLVIALLLVTILLVWNREWFALTQDETLSVSAPNIEQFRLSNGMEVLLVPNHRVPAVSHTLWLTIGSADDPRGKSGLAHYLEHLMFKGTKEIPTGEFSKRIEKLGGNHNAFTSRDFTGYYVNIAKEHLEEVMRLEADRFQHLNIPESEWKKEREVILEERRSRVDNRPSAILDEQMQASQFLNHPYRVPVIGWKHEMEALTLDDARNFYDYYYHPGNMLLVVAGDVTRSELEVLAERYYGTIPARKAATRNWLSEPPQLAAREVTLRHAQVHQPQWSRSYIAPSLVYGETQHTMPLQVLAHWLGGGRLSLLYRSLVLEQKIATSAGAYYDGLSRGPSSFSIEVTPAEGISLDDISVAVDALLEKARVDLVDDATLDRTKTLLKASAIYAQDGLEPIARFVGYLRMIGADLSYFTRWGELVDAITAEQVHQAAKAVLIDAQSVTGQLLPPLRPANAIAPTQDEPAETPAPAETEEEPQTGEQTDAQ